MCLMYRASSNHGASKPIPNVVICHCLSQVYADCLAQALFVTFFRSFPASLHQFNEDFKEYLLHIMHEWVTGEHEQVTGEHEWVTGEHEWVTGEHGWVTGEHGCVTGEYEWVTGEHEWVTDEHGWVKSEHEQVTGEHGQVMGEHEWVTGEHEWMGGEQGCVKGVRVLTKTVHDYPIYKTQVYNTCLYYFMQITVYIYAVTSIEFVGT